MAATTAWSLILGCILLASMVPAAATAECTGDLNWCSTNLPRTAEDKDHANCVGAARDCPCTCRDAYQAYRKERDEKQRKRKERKERAQRMVTAVQAALEDDAGGSDSDLTVYYVVRSQDTATDRLLTDRLEASLKEQGVKTAEHVLFVHRLPHEERAKGAWTLLPLLPRVAHAVATGGHAYALFVEPSTQVDVAALIRTLRAVSQVGGGADQELYVGHALRDTQSTIIHHEAHEMGLLPFPLLGAGFALSSGMTEKLAASIKDRPLEGTFHIEAGFEVSAFIRRRTKALLLHVPSFCTARGPLDVLDKDGNLQAKAVSKCATRLGDRYSHNLRNAARFPIRPRDVIVAVKTTKMFHESRLKLISETWGKDPILETVYLSDAAESGVKGAPGVKTVDLTQEWGAQVNQKRGHCAKCYAILQQFDKYYSDRTWFVIADDDTMFSMPRLYRLLQSHDTEKPVYLGERYGFSHGIDLPREVGGEMGYGGGYDYVTMGGGVAFNRPLLKKLLHECTSCRCAQPDEPDDMRFGHWVNRDMKLLTTHDDRFHQAELFQYHDEVLRPQASGDGMEGTSKRDADSRHLVSFHKFKMMPDANAPKGFSIDFPEMHRIYDEEMRDDATEQAIRVEEEEAGARAKSDEREL